MSIRTRTFRMTLVGLMSSLVVLTAGIGVARALAPAPSRSATAPELIAVKFHADWCGSCKAMGPSFIDLRNKFDDRPVLFVRFDFTSASDRVQSEYHAAALGLDSVWDEYGNKTGFILLIDADTKRIIDKLGPSDDFTAMKSMFTKAIEAAK